jgi:YfiH family protein
VSASNPPPTSSFRIVEETLRTDLPILEHPEWRRDFSWLIQGTTTAELHGRSFDLGLFSDASSPHSVLEAWERLRKGLGVRTMVHARQVHEGAVRFHRATAPGFHLTEACDGHATADRGVALAVTTADCVPVFLVDPERKAVALLHAGWRGTAAGILERGLNVLRERLGSDPGDVSVHLGPAICGACYEVGPEVFQALGLQAPAGPQAIHLRERLAQRAVASGVLPDSISISSHCTRCGGVSLFSHRGGHRQRQAAFLGLRQ